jgi:hypothetical protein
MDASRFVFLDETGTATNMTRRYGRSPRGQVDIFSRCSPALQLPG